MHIFHFSLLSLHSSRSSYFQHLHWNWKHCKWFLIPQVSMVPHDPTTQCPPTHIYKNRTIFSWIPLCAWHLLFLPHILCTKGWTYTCSHAHTLMNSLSTCMGTQSHVSGKGGRVRIYVVMRGNTMTPAPLWACRFLSDESIMWAGAAVWGHPLSTAFH